MKKLLVVFAVVFAVVLANVATVAQEKPQAKKDVKVVKTTEKKDACADCKDAATCTDKDKHAKKETVKKEAVKKEAKKGGPKAEASCCEKK